MDKNDLIMKAVIQLNGEMTRNYNGLIYSTSSNPVHTEGFIGHWDTDSKSDFLDYMDDCDTWEWLCTHDEFYQFIDELLETCIKWDDTEWNGEGLPPVGAICNIQFAFSECRECEITYMGDGVYCYKHKNTEYSGSIKDTKFRPIKTESEKERETLIRVLCGGHEEIALSVLDSCGWGEIADRVIKAGWRPNALQMTETKESHQDLFDKAISDTSDLGKFEPASLDLSMKIEKLIKAGWRPTK